MSAAGTSAERFDDSATTGFGLRAGIAVDIVPKVEARIVGRYDLFSSAFAASDTYVAEGATDHIYGVLLGGAFIY